MQARNNRFGFAIVITAFLITPATPVRAAQPVQNEYPAAKSRKQYRSVQSFRREAALSVSRKSETLDPALASLEGADGASLWSDKSPFFFVDRRASKVGDIITVLISESSNAKKEADTDINKTGSLAYTVPALPGYGEPLAAPRGRARRFDPADTLRTSSSNRTDIETEIERTDSLSATISARVVEVFPNGNLFVEGRREITTHGETLIVMVSGIVRPEDIDSNNSIQSKFIADAKIVYTGDGILAEAQSPGWLSRVATILWPF
ncbi:MAG: flagellar basal body L-ring protein FlgH [bacterium]